MNRQFRGILLLLLTAMIWGAAFVAQTVGMDYVEPFTYQAVRQFMGTLILLPVIFVRDRRTASSGGAPKAAGRELLSAGLYCGLFLFFATILQQFGLKYTSAGRSGFITALYILIVPLCGLVLGRRVSRRVWCAVATAITGMYFLCFSGKIAFGIGEFLTLGCSFCFAGHILVISKYGRTVDGVKLACLQFFVSSLISAVCMIVFEHPSFSALLACWKPLVYSGFISCGVGYTLQIIAQKDVDPTLASIVMSMESVFSVVFGWLLLGQAMSLRELLGCALMLSAIISAQMPSRGRNPS